ncbi:MmgE/PrpD family protein [Pusillimonas sp. SM2304]|uniref:MmgE/PrpD family protein n=1 Tax=Pusillimonas sp. SM2304 TaxID=3073241 RepID=UPI0028763B78|nr:MmgE/PrpD family protein [Pusillimonas sp. SM2304]MDS1139006.1 MmgE/PrpD family protein [Pusillimonas sp. SM2304]
MLNTASSPFMHTEEPADSVSSLLARHVAGTRYESLPADAVRASKALILDTLSVAWAGANATGIEQARYALSDVAQAGHESHGSACRIWGMHASAPALDAAFVNSAAAAALDFDPLHLDAVMHSQIMTLPALMAVAQQFRCRGKDFLAALVLADDINCRLSLSAQGHDGWFFTSIFGIFGTAAASAKLMGGDQAVISNALGIALFQVAGTQQSMLEKSLTKRFMAAFSARGGVFSAMLASAGITAPSMPLEGRFGLSSLYQTCDFDKALLQLGDKYENSAIHIKKYPCCGCSHALIEATLALTEKHSVRAGDVARISVRISEFMNRMIGGEFLLDKQDPAVLAQFNAKYAVACALLRHRFELEDLEPASVRDPAIGDIAERIAIEIDPENNGELVPATVILELASGQKLSQRIDVFPGATSAEFAPSALQQKARGCLKMGLAPLGPAQIDSLIERVENIESVTNMADFFLGM